MRALAFVWLVLWATLASGAVRAQLSDSGQNMVEHAELVLRGTGYVLHADISMQLSERLEEAVERGIALHFVAEFELERERSWWFNETVVSKSLNYRLSYQPITRQYRLSLGGLHQSMDSLDSALMTLQRIRNWPVVELDRIEPGEPYRAALRFRLDVSQLPKPFQVTALSSDEWTLATDWYQWRPNWVGVAEAGEAAGPDREPLAAGRPGRAGRP